jgi:hypothetical protein
MSIDNIIMDCQAMRGKLTQMEKELIELRDQQYKLNNRTQASLRAELYAGFRDAQRRQPYPKILAIQWLSTDERQAMARAAGFERICEAADFLNGVV